MKRYFANCTTLEELKAEYKKLVMIYHPDRPTGDLAKMQEINAEYDKVFPILKNTHKTKDGETYTKESTEEVNEFKDLLNKLIRMQGIHIEIIGSFIWISGDTKPFKDELKALGFRWSSNKSMWYKSPEGYHRRGKKHYSIDEIRANYGVQFAADGESKEERLTA